MGLQTIPSSKSAFITALYVPLVPILQWPVLRRPPGIMAWTGAGFAFAGMLALAGPDGIAGSLGTGEWVTLISTLVIEGAVIDRQSVGQGKSVSDRVDLGGGRDIDK